MATHGWRKSPSVEAWLFEEGHAFDFFQAVSLLERLRSDAAPLGEGADPSAEAVRFSSAIGFAFPETDVASVKGPRFEGEPSRMVVNFLSLAGALGPLALPFAELVYTRATRGDVAAREFLDIFNHRLVSLAYRIRKMHRIGLGVRSPEEDAVARHLYAVIGLASPLLRGRLAVPDRALLEHAGNLSSEARSFEGLLAILRRHFGVPFESLPLTGAFHAIEPSDRTAIGPSGRNRALGKEAGIGRRFWDQEATFELRVGPMQWEDFLRFLPQGDALAPLAAIVRFYVGVRFHFGVALVLADVGVPPLSIGKRSLAYLGQTTWLGRGRGERGRKLEVRLSRAAIARAERAQGAGGRGGEAR